MEQTAAELTAVTPTRSNRSKAKGWIGPVVFAAVLGGVASFTGSWLHRRATPTYPSFRALNGNGTPVHWVRREIVLRPVLPRHSISPADYLATLRFGIDAWNGALRGCSTPQLRLGPVMDDRHKVRQDGVSMVVVREGKWCSDDDVRLESCYDRSIEAITNLYPSRALGAAEDGAVREVDIEVNAVDYTWSLDGAAPASRNLRALMTHELGHALGLDHVCRSAQSTVAQTPGAPVCESSNTQASIMFPHVTTDRAHGAPRPGSSEITLLCKSYTSLGTPESGGR